MLLHLALLLTAPAQSVQHVFDVSRAASVIDWEITTSAATVNETPDKFSLDGTMNLLLDASQGPFTMGQFNGALMYTVPSLLHAEIPNPIFFLPPLATFDITNFQVSFSSAPFVIDPATGNFTAAATLHTTAGIVAVDGIYGASTQSIFGLQSSPSSVSGRVTQNGGSVELRFDLDVNVTQDLGGVIVTIVLDGPILATAQSASANPFLLTIPQPLTVGSPATFTASRAVPGTATWLAASLSGLGSTSVPPLGVTLGMANAVQVGGTVIANAGGNASWTVTVPALLSGRSAWFQAVQIGRTTPVAGSYAF